jgi:hypothetical protein
MHGMGSGAGPTLLEGTSGVLSTNVLERLDRNRDRTARQITGPIRRNLTVDWPKITLGTRARTAGTLRWAFWEDWRYRGNLLSGYLKLGTLATKTTPNTRSEYIICTLETKNAQRN